MHQLSVLSKVGYASLSDLKNGKRETLNTQNIIKLSKFFKVSISTLIGDTQDNTIKEKEPPESDPLTDEVIKLIKSLSEESLAKLIDYAQLLLNAEQNQ